MGNTLADVGKYSHCCVPSHFVCRQVERDVGSIAVVSDGDGRGGRRGEVC